MTIMRFLAFCLVLLMAGPALAGDFAEYRIIGFSDQGRHFAFEQFGRQDGSGFAYADIHVIDIDNNAPMTDTPIQVLLRDEGSTIAQARDQAASQAAAIFENLKIQHPGVLLASNPPAEFDVNPFEVRVNGRFPLPAEGNQLTFTLDQFPLPSSECAGLADQPVQGFRLNMSQPGAAPLVLHKDTAITKDRGCPLNYAISAIARLSGSDSSPVYAVLISVYKVGFEGPDRRFIAVTHKGGNR